MPADSPAIAKWQSSIEDGGEATVEVTMTLSAEGKGEMLANSLKLDLMWKQAAGAREIEVFILQGGKLKRGDSMKFEISEDGAELKSSDPYGSSFRKAK